MVKNVPTVFIANSFFPLRFYGSETQTVIVFNGYRRQAECAKTARIQMALPPGGKAPAAAAPTANLYEELGDSSM